MREADTKINRVGPRHTVYLQKDLVEDSTFPFSLNEPLTVRVDGQRLVIERTGRKTLAPEFVPNKNDEIEITGLLDSLGYTPILSRAEKIYEMLKEVHEAETLDLRVKHIPQSEHALLLWHDRRLLDHVLTEFFDPDVTQGVPKGLLSEAPYPGTTGTENVLFSQMSGKNNTSEKSGSVSENVLKWFDRMQSATKSPRLSARVAIEDHSWFIVNGFQDEVRKIEMGIGLHPEKGMSVLCSYNMSQISDQELLRQTLQAHSYVIIDSPFRVYRKKPAT